MNARGNHSYNENYWDVSDFEWGVVLEAFEMNHGPLEREHFAHGEYGTGRVLDGYASARRTVNMSGIESTVAAAVRRWETKR